MQLLEEYKKVCFMIKLLIPFFFLINLFLCNGFQDGDVI